MNIHEHLTSHPTAKILILGYGKEGKSTHEYLSKHFPELQISIADQNEVKPIFPIDQIYSGKEYLHHLPEYDVIFRTPSISFFTKEIQTALQLEKVVTSEMNFFFSIVKGKTIGVTGTKGKSTTSSLIAHFLKQKYPDVRLIGNIGKPALDDIDNANESTLFVVELSSFQLEDLHFSPNYAVLLGISEEHLNHHGTMEKYIDAKKNIFLHQTENDVLIFDGTNKIANLIAQQARSRKIGFSSASQLLPEQELNHQIASTKYSELNPQLIGHGYATNILAASTLAKEFSISDNQITEAIKTFQPLPHRLEYLGVTQGITFYDDSISTIPEATINALDALGENVQTLIAGGFDRGVKYQELGKYLAQSSLKNLILFSPSGKRIDEEVKKHSPKGLKIFFVESMEEAINLVFEHTDQGKICLLSPASASFGQFKDYIDRGNQFRKLLGFPESTLK